MSSNEKKRQQKLAEKKRKRSRKKTKIKKSKKPSFPKGGLMALGLTKPIFFCATLDMIDSGMETVLLARRINENRVLLAGFNLDLYCLGIKSAFIAIDTKEKFYEMQNMQNFFECPPEDAKKLILGSAKYAADLGFKPDKDYKKAMQIFHDVDETESTTNFTYGQNGKALFIGGPFDSPQKCKKIIETLEKSVGKENYHFMMPNSETEFFNEDTGK
ncbi:MAG: hypothetical protein U9O87_00335 [Verrucomicrobiota bacterium]|nr:hypothetical protein [Verrucomicrobiota bacterium]